MKKILILFFFIFIASCQPIERAELVVFDNNQLSKFDIFSKSIEIQSIFEKKISEPYIGYTLKISPHKRIEDWLNNNFKAISNENKFKVTILDASLIKNEFVNKNTKNFNDKKNYKYEIFYLIEFNLYDDYNNLIANTLVEIKRSTTSDVYISLQNKEKILNDLVYLSLVDLSNESLKLLKKYMSDYIL